MSFKKSALIVIGAVLFFCEAAFAGSYWRKVEVNHPGQINGVAMSPSGKHIVWSGDFDLHSSDRGVTWDTVSGFAPNIMDYGDEKHGFGVGSGQSGSVGVYRSSDSGKTWLRIGLPDNFINFNEVDFIDSIHGWAVGNKDFIVTTNDGWQTWTTKPFGLPGMIGGGLDSGTRCGVLSPDGW
jgi:photosystem II stability/assembly factor-like uncharacterized protein